MKRNHQPPCAFLSLANLVPALCRVICNLLNPHLCLAQSSVAVIVEDQAAPWSPTNSSVIQTIWLRICEIVRLEIIAL